MTETIGFIGLGAMGLRMAKRLVGTAPLIVHDINESSVKALASAGASPAGSAKEVADRAEIVFICLPNLKVSEAVIFGANGLTDGTRIKQVVDFSTTGSVFAVETSKRLAERGIKFVTAPISGGLVGAENGTLTVIASGPPDAVQTCRPYFERVGENIFDLGPSAGGAQTMKLMNNALSTTAYALTCEVMVMGVKAGLDPETMLDVINSSSGRNSASALKIPKAVLPRTFNYGAKTAITIKDISLCIEEADTLGVPMSIAKAAQKLWRKAIEEGAADKDSTTLITYMERDSGVEVRGRAATTRQKAARADS